MKKLILLPIILAVSLYAEDCSKYKLEAERWYSEAQGSYLKESYIREYNRAQYFMNKALYCQNQKLIKEK